MRVEGKPELPLLGSIWEFVELDALMHVGQGID